MDKTKEYVKTLLKITDLIIGFTDFDKNKKSALKKETADYYLNQYYNTLLTKLSQEDYTSITEVLKPIQAQQEKIKAVDSFIAQKIEWQIIANVALDTLEDIVKKMIEAVNSSVSEQSKKQINKQIASLYSHLLSS